MFRLSGRVPILTVLAIAAIAAGVLLPGNSPASMPARTSAQEVPPTATPTGFGSELLDLDLALARIRPSINGNIGVAVVRPGTGQVFASNSGQPFPLASVTKVYILVAYLDLLATEGGPLEDEIEDLAAMIEWSDNTTAQRLWDRLGGSDGMRVYLESNGFAGLWPGPEEDAWGDASQTASQVAAFLDGLISGELLDPYTTSVALGLLGSVTDGQRWGVSAGIPESDDGPYVMLKNGWYPTEDGWRINSIGLISPAQGGDPYVIVILGNGFETFEQGVDAVERVAALLNSVMLG